MTTRRDVLATATVAALTVPLVRAAPARAARPVGEAGVVFRLAEVEQALHLAYRLVADADANAPELETVALAFGGQEAAHLGALATALEALGADKPAAPRAPEQLDAAARALGIDPVFSAARGGPGLARFLLALERRSARACEAMVVGVGDPDLRASALTILGCQAQHAAVLEMLLGRGPVRSS